MENVEILIVDEPIALDVLAPLAKEWHGTLVKGVADIARGKIALGGEWHMDANSVLIADGARQEDVWGFNIYPEEMQGRVLEFISLINIRPQQGNRGMEITDEAVRAKIAHIVQRLIPDSAL